MTKYPSYALRNIIVPKQTGKPIWNRQTPTALERTASLINSSPLVLFARRKSCPDSVKLHKHLSKHLQQEFKVVYLEDIAQGNFIQRRLRDLTGQWTVPQLFARGNHIGGLNDTKDALRLGKLAHILGNKEEWVELIYRVRPDAWIRDRHLKPKSPMSFAMCLQDSHKFSYVHRERWAEIKRYRKGLI